MTVTDTPTAETPDTAADPTHDHTTAVGGFAAVLGSDDHKTIGRLYLVTSLLFLLVAGVAGGLLGLEKIDTSDLDVLDVDVFAQVFTLHAIAGVFLFLLPVLIGLAMIVVPLQVGAATVAFPRAAAASYWAFLVSGALVLAAYAINGGPFGGDGDGVDLFLAAFAALLVALCVASVCLATTVLTLRTPGMGLDRVPLFSWSVLSGAVVWILSLPVLAGVVVLLYVDHRYFREFLGGNAGIYDRIVWMFGQPSVYLFAVPALGVIADIVPVFAQTRHRRHAVARFAIAGFAVVALGAWAQPGFGLAASDGLSRAYVDEGPWMVFGFLALGPILVLLALWGDTLRQGAVKAAAPLIYALGAVVMLFVAVAVGAVTTVPDLDLTDTTWVSSQVHYVTLAATLAVFGGVTYWAPKIFGRTLPENLSRLTATLLLVGTIGLAFPDVISGALDQFRGLAGVADPDRVDLVEVLNIVSLVGGLLVIVAALLFVDVLIVASVKRTETDDDPWHGHTLEWATASPPPVGNFAAIPEITSEAPLYDARHAASASEVPS